MVAKLNCSQCGRKVHPTTHKVDTYKVDYYIVASTLDEDPVVICVECHKEK